MSLDASEACTFTGPNCLLRQNGKFKMADFSLSHFTWKLQSTITARPPHIWTQFLHKADHWPFMLPACYFFSDITWLIRLDSPWRWERLEIPLLRKDTVRVLAYLLRPNYYVTERELTNTVVLQMLFPYFPGILSYSPYVKFHTFALYTLIRYIIFTKTFVQYI